MPKISFSLPVSIFKEDDTFVAYTPALDISTAGSTLSEAKKNFEELVAIFLGEVEQKGTTAEVLESMGWKKVAQNWSAPIEVEHSIETFNVPVQ